LLCRCFVVALPLLCRCFAVALGLNVIPPPSARQQSL
jgi:hypothetical protein